MDALYAPPRRTSLTKAAVWIILAIAATLLMLHPARAQTVHVGQVVRTNAVICDKLDEATALLDAMATGGMEAAQAYVSREDNTCAVQMSTFRVGAPIGLAKADPTGTKWQIIHVSPPDGSRDDYSVVPQSILLTGA